MNLQNLIRLGCYPKFLKQLGNFREILDVVKKSWEGINIVLVLLLSTRC